MATNRKVWSPEALCGNSFGYPIGLQFQLKQIFDKNQKTDAMIVGGEPMGEKNLFIALFDKDDIDFEIGIKNRSQWNVKCKITVGNKCFSYVLPKGVEALMKALQTNGKHLHFLSQKTDDGKLLVAMSAKRNRTTYEEAAVSCSRIEFHFTVERSEEEKREEKKAEAREKTRIKKCLRDRRLSKNGAMIVYVKTLTGKTIDLKLYPHDTIALVKSFISYKEGLPLDQPRLIFSGRQLEDEKTLADYCVTDGCTIHMILRLTGGGCYSGPYVFSGNGPEAKKMKSSSDDRGVVCFGQQTNQRFDPYTKQFIRSKINELEGFIVELRTKPKYSIFP